MEKNKVFLSTRLIVKSIPFWGIVAALMGMALTLFPLSVSADEDPGCEMGIYIGNQTTRDVWYTRNGGPCTLWARGHILMIKPEDTLMLYSDMICKTEYCSENPTYDALKFRDVNRNCRVRILPRCTLSDM